MVAEHVETEERRRLTQVTGVDLVQGYRISHALPRDELVGWLDDTSARIGPSEEGREAFPWPPERPRRGTNLPGGD